MQVLSKIRQLRVSLLINSEVFPSIHVVYVWVLHILEDSSEQLEQGNLAHWKVFNSSS